MPRLKPVDANAVNGDAKQALAAVEKKMGRVPNIFSLMANSPAALNAYLNFSDALSKGLLDAQTRERIAIVCAETNECEYCLAAHMVIGKSVGLSDEELKKARQVQASDAKADAAIKFARLLLLRKADVKDDDVQVLKDAGLSDGEIAEIVANVSLNIFTNYFNHVAETEIDFPKVQLAFPFAPGS